MTIETICLLAGVKPADLSAVPDPRGRVDHLASKLIENSVKSLPAECQLTYMAARPLIDGLLARHLGHVRIPEEAMKATGDIVTSIERRKTA